MKIKMLPALNGDCIEILFEDPTPRLIIIDSGIGKHCRAMLKKDVYNWKKEHAPVDLVVLTHTDNDHIYGFLSLLKDKSFDDNTLAEMWFNYGEKIEGDFENRNLRLYINDETYQTSSRKGIELYQILKDRNIPLVAPITSGKIKKYGEYSIEVISPNEDCLIRYIESDEYIFYNKRNISETQTAARKNDYHCSMSELLDRKFNESSVTRANASSIAVMITGRNCRVLCLGDAKSSEVERELRDRGYNENNPLVIDFLKVSHHGSAYSTSDSLIKILECNNYLISTNWKGFPAKECLTRIIVNSRGPVTFWCNYKPNTSIFTEDEYKKYSMKFKYIGSTEIEVDGKK